MVFGECHTETELLMLVRRTSQAHSVFDILDRQIIQLVDFPRTTLAYRNPQINARYLIGNWCSAFTANQLSGRFSVSTGAHSYFYAEYASCAKSLRG